MKNWPTSCFKCGKELEKSRIVNVVLEDVEVEYCSDCAREIQNKTGFTTLSGTNWEGTPYREIVFNVAWKGDLFYTAGVFDLLKSEGCITHLYEGESDVYKTVEAWKQGLRDYGYKF